MIRDFFPQPGAPCPQCGVRPDLGCSHRAADPDWRAPEQRDEADRRKLAKDKARSFGNRTIASGGGAYRIKAARKAGLLGEPFA